MTTRTEHTPARGAPASVLDRHIDRIDAMIAATQAKAPGAAAPAPAAWSSPSLEASAQDATTVSATAERTSVPADRSPRAPEAREVATSASPRSPRPHATTDQIAGLDIAVDAVDKATYAYAHNRVPIVRSLRIATETGGPSGLLDVTIEASWSRESKPPARTARFTVEAPEPGAAITITDTGFKLDDTVLVDLEEAAPATFRVTVRTERGDEHVVEHDVTIMARNQWYFRTDYGEAIAAYVQPNHPATREVLSEAATILQRRTGSSSIEGYQNGPERATEIARAIYEAFQSYGIGYTEPPASFETSQKLRPLDDLLEARRGTCIDLACAYASCLEQAGLRPLLWIVPAHAFAGFLREEGSLPESVEWDANRIVTLRDAGLAVPVETIGLTDSRSFDDAIQATRMRFSPSQFGPEAPGLLLDVHRAHRAGTLPLPARVVRGDVVEIVVDPGPGRVPMVETREKATGRLLAEEAPPRVRRWQASLLDLSFNNPLLKFSTNRRGLDLLVAPGGLARLEDDLVAGRTLDVHGGDVLEGAEAAAGLRDIAEAGSDVLERLYGSLGVLYTPSGEADGGKRVRSLATKARLVEGETGANNLFLALGTLIWSVGGKEVRSPLYLVPVRLERPKGRSLARIRIDETGFTSPNYCLAEKLRGEFGLDVPGYEAPDEDASGIDIDQGLAALRGAIVDRGLSFRIDETAHLAILAFSTFRLWKDMRDHWGTFVENPVVHHLVHAPGTPFRDPAGDEPLDLHEAKVAAPVPLDGSQLRAVARAAAGHSYVLEGPPGTGKSQTITNLLAHALANGRTVLFVAEKQAALSVVKQRLTSVGLDPYCLDLHDKGSTPSEIRDQLKMALEHSPNADLDAAEQVRRRLETTHDALADYRDRLHRPNPLGHSYAYAHRRRLKLGDGPATPIPGSLVDAGADVARDVETAVLDVVGPAQSARPSRRHPWRFADSDAFDDVDRSELAAAIRELGEARAALGATEAPLARLLATAREPDDIAAVADLLRVSEDDEVPDAVDLDAVAHATWPESIDGVVASLRSALRELKTDVDAFGSDVVKRPFAELDDGADAVDAAAATFLIGRRGRTNKALRAMLGDRAPALKAPEAADLARSVVKRRRAFDDAKRAAVDVPGIDPSDLEQGTDEVAMDRVHESLLRRHRVANLLTRRDDHGDAAREWASRADGRTTPPDRVRRLADAASRLLTSTAYAPAGLAAWLDGRGWLEAIDASLDAWTTDADEARFPSLRRWLRLVDAVRPLERVDAHEFARMVLDGDVPATQIDEAFQRGLLDRSLREREEALDLDAFDANVHDRTVDRYVALVEARRHGLEEVVPVALKNARSFDSSSSFGAVGALRSELNRKRGARSVRSLVATYPELVQSLTPCFLTSPDSVAKFLPAGQISFDMVVFDEASQIDLAEAVGAMGRARSVVIVGDSKQMPPTRFGGVGGNDDDPFADMDMDEVPEDGESLLVEAVESGLDREWLSWHYRSRDESLIAFSNRHYYENRLASFPGPDAGQGRALSWIRVDGQFEHGKRRINEAEAGAIVDKILELMHAPDGPRRTIGVITLNIQQRDEIQRRLEESGDPLVMDALDADDDSGLFVRNLEAVQGHERDVILFSTGFSKRADGGRMPLNFGPLNRAGGERRLNVAVTRARDGIVVFSSFEPEEIEESRTSALGMLHLREFLMTAKHGVRTTEAADDPDSDDPHFADVCAALTTRGLEVATDVGLSPFRVDVAVRRPGSERWHVAVLLDGARWAERATVGDRDGLPLTVLRDMMNWPRVARVWLPAWREDPAPIADHIAELVDEAIADQRTVDRGRDRPDAGPASTRATPMSASPAPLAAADTDGSLRTASTLTAIDAVRRRLDRFATKLGAAPPADVSPAAVPPVASVPPRGPAPVQPPQFGSAREPLRPKVAAEAITSEGPTFVPYPTDRQVGPSEAWPRDYVPQGVIDTAKDVVAHEGPIEARRLGKIVGSLYGLGRVHTTRIDALIARLPRALVHRTRHGIYLWPAGLDPATYDVVRPERGDPSRTIDEVAPEEIIATMRRVATEAHTIPLDDLVKAAAGRFGVKRVTKGIEQRLAAVAHDALAAGRLVDTDAGIRAS